jgi:hypothetical protein
MMNLVIVITLLLALPGADDPESAKALRERLLKLHQGDALEFTIYRDASHKEPLKFRKEPVYIWTNPVRFSQQGALFVWTSRGRPEAIATIFSSGGGGMRGIAHEFHSLSLSALKVERQGEHKQYWRPKGPGIELVLIDGAPAPAGSPAQRLGQMRELARAFSASTRDRSDNRYKLRLLPQPLYRYESTDPEPDVVDGALFAFVTSAGTDPEALLVIEARRPRGGGPPIWQRALARFTDLDLSVQHMGKVIYRAPDIEALDSRATYPREEYRIYEDRTITDGPASAAGGTKP